MKLKKSKIEACQVKTILDALFKVNGTTLEQLVGHKRKYVFDRMIFSDYCNEKYTFEAIAEFMNMKSHASILSHLKQIQNDLKCTIEFKEMYLKVYQYIENEETGNEVELEIVETV